jgi:hypothetical protein
MGPMRNAVGPMPHRDHRSIKNVCHTPTLSELAADAHGRQHKRSAAKCHAQKHDPGYRQNFDQTQRKVGGRQTPLGSVDKAKACAGARGAEVAESTAGKENAVVLATEVTGQICPVLHNWPVLEAVAASLQQSASVPVIGIPLCMGQGFSTTCVAAMPWKASTKHISRPSKKRMRRF